MKKSTKIGSLEELKTFASDLIPQLGTRQILILSGPMGAGKTTFVRFLVEALGGQGSSSPTFALHQTYKTKRCDVDHVDLFRLKNDQDLESIGFWDLFDLATGLVIVEWGERISEWPQGWKILRMEIQVPIEAQRISQRIVTVTG